MASDLDRVDHHRTSPEWVANLWRDGEARLLKIDNTSRFTTNVGGSKLRMTKPFVEYDDQRHRLLGMLNGCPVFVVEALTEGEVHDFREVGFQLSDSERDIAATAAAVCNWHRTALFCGRCGLGLRHADNADSARDGGVLQGNGSDQRMRVGRKGHTRQRGDTQTSLDQTK